MDKEMQKKQGREAAKTRKKERRDDATARLKAIKQMAPTMNVFNAGMNQGPAKKRVSKLVPSEKIIINAVETNRKRH